MSLSISDPEYQGQIVHIQFTEKLDKKQIILGQTQTNSRTNSEYAFYLDKMFGTFLITKLLQAETLYGFNEFTGTPFNK